MQKLSCNVQFAAATIKQFTMFPKQVMPRTGCACTAYTLVSSVMGRAESRPRVCTRTGALG